MGLTAVSFKVLCRTWRAGEALLVWSVADRGMLDGCGCAAGRSAGLSIFLLAVQGSLAGSLAVVISPLESKRSKSAAAIFEMKIFQLCFKCGMQCGGYQFLVCDGQ
ncbi:hypothetical protein XF_1986 [Xylella fastidiosa 9a5c]|uniref:Uncharacterized protein n=1 Tax=Xylella fastidiosa (strain 9a5c) TaxID=160492 RepID=Q9PBZ9_XYLFA|nr:hypothetical protein XF_1986 [Xylella fastidiosa 9a5c]